MAIKSMTGFGQAEAQTPSGSYRIEIRGVNNRFLEIQLRQPRFLGTLETRIKQMVTAAISRGSLSIVISSAAEEGGSSITWDKTAVENYVRIFREIQTTCNLGNEIRLADLMGFTDIIKVQSATFDEETLWNHLNPLLQTALKDFDRSREKEGAQLTIDLKKQLAKVEQTNELVLKRAPTRIQEYRDTLQKRISDLIAIQPDPVRIAQEVAIMADRLDISEESTRLIAHCKSFLEMLESAEPVGKRMNFLLQEMNRESNTIGSKANDTEISHLSIQLKEYVEKIREQIQNIE